MRIIWLLLLSGVIALPAMGEVPARSLLDFEQTSDLEAIKPQSPMRLVRSPIGASSGAWSLSLSAPKGQATPTFDLAPELLRGWQDYRYFTFTIYTRARDQLRPVVELHDAASSDYASRATYEGARQLPPTRRGTTVVQVDLHQAWRNAHADTGRVGTTPTIDLATLKTVRIYFNMRHIDTALVVYLDDFRLTQQPHTGTDMGLDLPADAIAFDFGDTRLVPGFRSLATELRTGGSAWPDPLAGDYVTADEGVDWELRIPAPPGRYLAWILAGYLPAFGTQPRLSIGDHTLWNHDFQGEQAFSSHGLLRFLDMPYSERPGALWASSIDRIYPATLVPVDIGDDGLLLRGRDSFVSAILLMPASRRAAMMTIIEQLQTQRQAAFMEPLTGYRPPDEPTLRTDDHLLLFAPAAGRAILPWSGIGPEDGDAITLTAAPAQTLWVRVGMRPFADSQADLAIVDEHERQLPADHATIYLNTYRTDGHEVRPWYLAQATRLQLERGLTRELYLRLRLPAEATSQTFYLVASSHDNFERRLPIHLRLHNLTLVSANELPCALALFYRPPWQVPYLFPQAAAALRPHWPRLLREQLTMMAEYGLNSVELTPPSLAPDGTLDTTRADLLLTTAREVGLLPADRPQRAPVFTLWLTRQLAQRLGGRANGEGDELLLPGFEFAFLQILEQLHAWSRHHAQPLAIWLVDEPRQHPNSWNRTFPATRDYYRLARQVPDITTLLTFTADAEEALDLLPLVDLAGLHPDRRSAKLLDAADRLPNTQRWFYNAGNLRLSYGLHPWAHQATGRLEWHFHTWLPSAPSPYPGREIHNPFTPAQRGFTVPGPLDVPGGVLPTDRMVAIAEGILDVRYAVTLERAIAAATAAKHSPETVAEAQRLLRLLRAAVPLHLDDEAATRAAEAQLPAWRAEMARLIEILQH